MWLLAGSAVAATVPTAANGLVALVDEEVITWKDVEQEAAPAIESKVAIFSSRPAQLQKEIDKARQDALEILIERKLILHEFKKAGYSLPDSIVEDRVKARLRERYGNDRVSMTKDLQSRGLTHERLREQERERFIVSAMRAKNIGQEIVVSPYKIEKYYADHLDKWKVGEEVRLRTVMVNKGNTEESAATARRRIDEIVAKLAEGAAFAEMAGVYSDDTFRSQGGDRGWVELEKQHYHQQLNDAIRALQPGQRSGVVDTGAALWIVLLEDRRPSRVLTLPEVRGAIEENLINEERARLEKQWIDRLKAKSFVRTF